MGYTVTSGGIKADGKRIGDINKMKLPPNVKELKSFLGMTS